MRLIFKIFIIMLLSYTTIFAKIEILKISDNFIDLKFLNYNQKATVAVIIANSKIKIDYSEKLKPLKDNDISIENGFKIRDGMILVYYSNGLKDIRIKNLKEESKYFIKVFSFEKNLVLDSLKFHTLSKEPTEQAKYIVFKNTRQNETTLLFKKGNGTKRIIFVSSKKKMALPNDGKYYKANSSFGAFESAVDNNTYCVYNGNGNEVKVTGFKPETKYYFRIFEYNGNNQTSNYLLKKESQNPRNKIMPLPPPVALPAVNITSDGFIAKWKKVDGAKYYEIDVSQDKNFGSYLKLYEHMDVGDIDEIEVVELKPGTYYYRLKAIGKLSRSPYSNVIRVIIKKKDEKN